MMRICSPQLGISPDAVLGGEVYDREILTRIAQMDTQIEIVLPAGLDHPHVHNLQVVRVPLRRGYRWFVSNPLFVPFLGRVYRQRPFDLLRVHSLRFTGPAALAARRLYRLPVPVIAHHHHLDRDRWTDHLERRVAQNCDLIITGSEFARRQLCGELDVPAERVRVVAYGVSESYIRSTPDEGLLQRWEFLDKRVLLYVGSLKARKNLPVLLQAMAQVLRTRNDVCLALVGRGEGEDALRAQVQELGLGNAVRFVGFVSDVEKLAWYNSCDIFVQPSRLEGFGLVATEAMACGRPVIASRSSALPEVIVDDETGLLCDPEDPGDFARAILQLLRDRTLARDMGQAGIERAQRMFRGEACAKQTLALYKEAVRNWTG